MTRKKLGKAGWFASVVVPALWLLCTSCAPPPLTESEAALLIRRERLSNLVHTTYLNPMIQSGCLDRTRYLVHCEDAGLVSVRWVHQELICGEFEVDLTEKGEEFFGSIEFVGRREQLYTTKGWEAALRQPITLRLVEITAIEDLSDGRKSVAYTWEHVYPPLLEGCTRNSQPEIYQDDAILSPSIGSWIVEPRPRPRTPVPVPPQDAP